MLMFRVEFGLIDMDLYYIHVHNKRNRMAMEYVNVFNGFANDKEGNKAQLLNAHICYKGRSVIIDYEWCLHCYNGETFKAQSEEYVPFEVYPYGRDIYVGYAPLDENVKKVDISKVLESIDSALENEPQEEPYDWSEFDN
jgi:hypothetical protein